MSTPKYLGQRFGNLIAVEVSCRGRKAGYIVQCDCGKRKWVPTDNLRRIKSCGRGCRFHTRPRGTLAVGERFGELTLIRNGWLVQCSCGKRFFIAAGNIRFSKSCMDCYKLSLAAERENKNSQTFGTATK